MPDSPSLTRLRNGHYNLADWNAATNPGGMGGDGHRYALIPPKAPQTPTYPVMVNDLVAVATETTDNKDAAQTAAGAAAIAAAAAAGSAATVASQLADLQSRLYIQSADPGAVGAGKVWVAPDGTLRVRNAANNGWSVTTLPETASATVTGILRLATGAEVAAGTDTQKAVTPATLLSRTASDTQTGLVELATGAEVQTRTDTARAVTPAGLGAVLPAFTGAAGKSLRVNDAGTSLEYIPSINNPAPFTAQEALSVGDFLSVNSVTYKLEKMRTRDASTANLSQIGSLNYQCRSVFYVPSADRCIYLLQTGSNIHAVVGTPTYGGEMLTGMTFGAITGALVTDVDGASNIADYFSAIFVESTNSIYMTYPTPGRTAAKIVRLSYSAGTVTVQNAYQFYTAPAEHLYERGDLCWNSAENRLYLIYVSNQSIGMLSVLTETLGLVGSQQILETGSVSVNMLTCTVCYSSVTQRVYGLYPWHDGWTSSLYGRVFSSSGSTINVSARLTVGGQGERPSSRAVAHPTSPYLYLMLGENLGLRRVDISTTGISGGGGNGTASVGSTLHRLHITTHPVYGTVLYIASSGNSNSQRQLDSGGMDTGGSFSDSGYMDYASALIPSIRTVVSAQTVDNALYVHRTAHVWRNQQYIGIAMTAAAADGTVQVALPGACLGGFSGLTPGNFYYIQSNGTLGGGYTSIPFGLAVSPTRVNLIGGRR